MNNDPRSNQVLPEDIKFSIQQALSEIRSNNRQQATNGLTSLIQIIWNPSVHLNQLITFYLIQQDVLTDLKQFLSSRDTSLVSNAAWALSNIVARGARQDTERIVQEGFVKLLVDVLCIDDYAIKDNALWALGNISGECEAMRDVVLSEGVIEPLNDLVQENNGTLLQTAAWVTSNLTRWRPPLDVIKLLIPSVRVLLKSTTYHIREEACDCFSNICIAGGCQYLHKEGLVTLLIQLLDRSVVRRRNAIIVALGNFASNAAPCLCHELSRVLPIIKPMLKQGTTKAKTNICWLLSNYITGSPKIIQTVIDEGLIPMVSTFLTTKTCPRLQREAFYVIANAICDSDVSQRDYLTRRCIPAIFCVLKYFKDMNILDLCIPCLEIICSQGEDERRYLRELGALPIIHRIRRMSPRYTSTADKVLQMLMERPIVGGRSPMKLAPGNMRPFSVLVSVPVTWYRNLAHKINRRN